MRPWLRYALFALALAVPASAYAYWQMADAGEACPVTPDCPCNHGD